VLYVVLPSLKFSGLAIRCLVAAVPALVLVLFAGLIAFIGLFMGKDRREYLLDLTAKLTELARVLMGPAFSPGADPPAIEVGQHDAKLPLDNAATAGSMAIIHGRSDAASGPSPVRPESVSG
jgi:hypothetical protein